MYMNTKYAGKVASGIAVAMIVAAPIFAGAVSIEDLQGQVKNLMAQIAKMQSQTTSQSGVTVSASDQAVRAKPQYRICSLVARNLAQGSRGDDVSSLQEFLKGEGYLSANATGFYGSLTASAVAKWQTAEGISAAGSVGPLSRARISKLCGGIVEPVNAMRFEASPASGAAPLDVTFSTWLSGFRINTISYMIDYGDGTSEAAASCNAPADACISPGLNTHTYASNGTYVATLNQITNPCAGQETLCKAAIRTEVVGKQIVRVGETAPIACTKEYKPVCGSKQVVCIKAPCNPVQTTYGNLCTMKADGAQYLYDGQCKDTSINPADDPQCKAYFDGCNSCGRTTPGGPAACTLMYCENPAPAYCKAYFDSSSNKPPTISGISGPSTLAISSTGTWTIQASDPEGGQLSYQVWWGDENAYASGMTTASAARDFTQSTTFTHSYANAGTYTVTITVQDPTGQSAKTSTTVKVGSDVVACTMEYAPVCGQPKWSCPSGMFCATMMPAPQTYGNRCQMNAAGATYISEGQCSSPYVY